MWILFVGFGFLFPVSIAFSLPIFLPEFRIAVIMLIWSAIIPSGGWVLLCSVLGDVFEYGGFPQQRIQFIALVFVSCVISAALILTAIAISTYQLAQSGQSGSGWRDFGSATVFMLVMQVSFAIIGVWSSARVKEGIAS